VYTIDSLVANLGGVLGLYLGGSVMTLVQLVFFLIGRWRKPFDGSTHRDDKVVVWRELRQEVGTLRAEMAMLRLQTLEKLNLLQEEIVERQKLINDA
jgi:Amiloride-sensitive sodium channel